MTVYTNTVTLPPSSTINRSSYNTGNKYLKNNGQSTSYNGMPSKDGFADNGSSFSIARRFYNNYKQPDSITQLENKFLKEEKKEDEVKESFVDSQLKYFNIHLEPHIRKNMIYGCVYGSFLMSYFLM